MLSCARTLISRIVQSWIRGRIAIHISEVSNQMIVIIVTVAGAGATGIIGTSWVILIRWIRVGAGVTWISRIGLAIWLIG